MSSTGGRFHLPIPPVDVGEIRVDYLDDAHAVFEGPALYRKHSSTEILAQPYLSDRHAQIDLPVGAWLVLLPGRTMVVDAGAGPELRAPYEGGHLLDSLGALGFSPADVDDVVYTHLHFDHVGWTSFHGAPTFPNAVYRCHENEAAHYLRADYEMSEIERHRIRPHETAYHRFGPVMDRLETWSGDLDLGDGVRIRELPGHHPGHSGLVLTSGGETALMIGDAAHLPVEMLVPGWGGLGDMDPPAAERTRRRLTAELADAGTLFCAAHFGWGRFIHEGAGIRWDPIL